MASTSPIPVTVNSGGGKSKPGLGIACMALALFIFSAVDTQAKLLTEFYHPVQIVWFRQIGLVVGVLFLLAYRGLIILKTEHIGLQITRGVLAASSATLFIFAVSFVPLADAVAISFVAPFIVTIFGALVLKEKVGIRRWSAVTIGFIGTLIVIRPGLGVMHPAGALVVIAASFFAFRQILSRYLGDSDRTETTVAYTALASVVIISVPLPFIWETPRLPSHIALLLSVAVMSAVAETLVIKSLELAQAVVLAPLHYTLIIWGTIYGFFVFDQLPDMWTWVGAAIIIASGLYTLSRERLSARK